MGIRLAVVDDATFIHEVLPHIFHGTEIDLVGSAENGKDAIELIFEKKPDMVLLDMILPFKNGVDVAKEVLKKSPEIKIIAMSTAHDEDIIYKAINAGCVDFIKKPFKAKELIDRIQNIWKSFDHEDLAVGG
jgi:YesN/AraC family two-component response regulator